MWRQILADRGFTCGRLFRFLDEWNERTGLGIVNIAPGVIFAEDDDVAPDIVWISRERLATGLDEAGHLSVAPEIVIEVLSPGAANERRDRQTKLKLYARRGVQECWIVDWMRRQVEMHRRERGTLTLAVTLYPQDTLESPQSPSFSCRVAALFVELLPRRKDS